MKKSIRILVAVSILFLMSSITQAQIHDWTGKWNTTFLGNNWVLNITKSGDSYTGTFPNGKLAGKYKSSGDLIGTYTRTVTSFDKTGMGKMGEFRFIMNGDNKSFLGEYTPEGKEMQPDNWNGKRPTTPTLVQQVEINKIKENGEVMNDYVKNNPIANWTGTWETEKKDKLKVWVKGYHQLVGKISYKKDGTVITANLTGSNTGSNGKTSDKTFAGSFVDSKGVKGSFDFYFGRPTDDDFSGYMNYLELDKSRVPNEYRTVSVYFKGHRTSSAKPNMNTYN